MTPEEAINHVARLNVDAQSAEIALRILLKDVEWSDEYYDKQLELRAQYLAQENRNRAELIMMLS